MANKIICMTMMVSMVFVFAWKSHASCYASSNGSCSFYKSKFQNVDIFIEGKFVTSKTVNLGSYLYAPSEESLVIFVERLIEAYPGFTRKALLELGMTYSNEHEGQCIGPRC